MQRRMRSKYDTGVHFTNGNSNCSNHHSDSSSCNTAGAGDVCSVVYATLCSSMCSAVSTTDYCSDFATRKCHLCTSYTNHCCSATETKLCFHLYATLSTIVRSATTTTTAVSILTKLGTITKLQRSIEARILASLWGLLNDFKFIVALNHYLSSNYFIFFKILCRCLYVNESNDLLPINFQNLVMKLR